MEIDWPKKGDKLFTNVAGPYSSCINWMHEDEKQQLYASAFESVAINLIDGMIKTRSHLDTFIYPVIFCFRHSLELRMKNILKMAMTVEEIKIGKALEKHDLLLLWSFIKIFIENHFNEDDSEVLNHVEECLKEFSKVDRVSMAFRYPLDLDGNQHLDGINYIDNKNLRITMKALFNFFGGVESVMRQILEAQSDSR